MNLVWLVSPAARLRRDAARLFARLPLLTDADCLEIGCGSGLQPLLIAHYTGCRNLVVIDGGKGMSDQVRATLATPPEWAGDVDADTISFAREDPSAMSFRNGSFGGVFHFGCLGRMPRWKRVITEACRVLEDGGVYAFTEPRVPGPLLWLARLFGIKPVDTRELQEALTTAGFALELYESGGAFTPLFVVARKPHPMDGAHDESPPEEETAEAMTSAEA